MVDISLPRAVGRGVPAGGLTGQVLVKTTGMDYDTQWATPEGGGSEGIQPPFPISYTTGLQEALNLKANLSDTIISVTTSRDLATTDNGAVLEVNSASAVTLTVPSTLPAGFNCIVSQVGAGQVTIAAGTSATVTAYQEAKTPGQWGEIAVRVRGTAGVAVVSGGAIKGGGSGGVVPDPPVPPDPAETIGGIAIGTAGTGPMSGYSLAAGDDFGSALDIVTPAKPFGRYPTTRAYLLPTNANGPRGAVGGLSLKGYDVDPFHTGHNDKNRGAARASWADSMVQQDSVLKLKVRTASTAERALFNPDLNVNNIAAMIHTAGDLIFKPPFHIEFRARLTKAQLAMGGYHPSFWLMQMDPPRSGDGLEIDWEGESDLIEANYFDWSGGTSTASKGGNIDTVYDGQFHTFGLEVTATHLRWFYDGSLFREQAKILQFPDKPFYALVTSHVTNFASDPYSDANWTAAGSEGAFIDLDYIRLWQPADAVKREPLLPPVEYEAAAGATFSFTLPPAVDVWGSAINERVEAFISESNSPGGNYNGGFAGWPAGISYNAATRILSGASTQPGTLHIVRYPLEGGFARPQRLALHIGPRVTVSSLPNGQVGQPYSFDLYAAVEAGQLTSDASGQRAKTITVSGLPAGLSYNDSIGMVTGTPTAAASATVGLNAVNSRGQAVVANLSMTIAAASAGYVDTLPVTSGLLADINPDDTSKVTASGGLVDSVAPSNGTAFTAASTGTARPTYVTGATNFLRATGSQEMVIDPGLATALSGAPAYSIVVIAKINSNATTQYFIDIGKAATASNVDRISVLQTANDTLRHRKAGPAVFEDAVFPALATNAPHVLFAKSSAGAALHSIRVDGGTGAAPATAVAAGSGFDTATLFNRKSSSGNARLSGDIYRVLVFNRVLSSTEEDSLRAWAQGKFGTP